MTTLFCFHGDILAAFQTLTKLTTVRFHSAAMLSVGLVGTDNLDAAYFWCAMTFGDRLKLVRGEKSRDDFALQLHVHKNTIARWERGDQYPDAHEIELILKAYPQINPTWFVTGEGSIKRKESRAEHAKESQLVYTTNLDAELEEILKILRYDLPEAKPFILKVLHGQLEVKEGLEGLRLGGVFKEEGKK